ncbi:MAG: hypothetical protein U0Y68_20525 [Blastocatellia bacterium]
MQRILFGLSLLMLLPWLAAAQSPVRIINFGAGGWKDGQVNEPVILVNPKDASRLIMFYSGMQLGGSRGAIGKAWAKISEPLVWHEDADNPILVADPNIPFEASALRLNAVVYHQERDEYWIYYTGSNFKTQHDAIGLATCPAGQDGYSQVVSAQIKRYAGNPILSPNGQGRDDETYVSQGAVFREKGKWYSLYSYRTPKAVLPGIRLAVSRDGRQWTKVAGADLLSAAPESQYIEWHQVYKIGKQYVLLYEGYNGGTRWGADVAVSSRLTSGWRKAPTLLIDQTRWLNYSDETLFHVATPALYQFQRKWYLYFQAAHSGYYIRQHWALWGMACDEMVQRIAALR